MSDGIRFLPIHEIKVGTRHRRDLGDLHALADGIEVIGLLQPVGVTPEMELIFGERRLRACREVLGWDTIPARIIQIPAIPLGEYAENLDRKEFTPSERVAIVDTLRGYSHGGDRRSDRGRNCDVDRLTIKRAAALVGDSKDDYYRAKKVVERGVPELVQAMDQGLISVSLAAKVAEEEPEVQREIVGAGFGDSSWVASKIRATRRRREERRSRAAVTQETVPYFSSIGVNSIVQGDCMELIPSLPDRSIQLVLTSPPYAEQRNGLYRGVPEKEYPEFTVRWMSHLWDKLADDGSVLIVIRPDLKDGVVKDYVLRTRLALREFGWKECETLIWHKPDGGACMGSLKRPRRTYEEILWFSKTGNPYADIKACGRWSENVSFRGSTRFGMGGSNPVHGGQDMSKKPGRTRVTDVFKVPVASINKGIKHPAMYPVPLAEKLIMTFCPQGGTVLDNFCGSGSTLVAAKKLDRNYYGFDLESEYCRIARDRLATLETEIPPLAG